MKSQELGIMKGQNRKGEREGRESQPGLSLGCRSTKRQDPTSGSAFSDLWPSVWLGVVHLRVSRVLGEARVGG